jgi:hypothetical protein
LKRSLPSHMMDAGARVAAAVAVSERASEMNFNFFIS